MDVLAYLVERHEKVVSADELLERYWPGRVVEQSTIHRRINQIRRALGDDAKDPAYIQTIVKRGYRAIAEVERTVAGDDLVERDHLARITPPFMAYEGNEPFMFACYSHRNREQVYRELSRLNSQGVHVWPSRHYDPYRSEPPFFGLLFIFSQ